MEILTSSQKRVDKILVVFPLTRVVSHKKSKYICLSVGLFYVKLIMS